MLVRTNIRRRRCKRKLRNIQLTQARTANCSLSILESINLKLFAASSVTFLPKFSNLSTSLFITFFFRLFMQLLYNDKDI